MATDPRIKQRIPHDPKAGEYHKLWSPAMYSGREGVETLDKRGRAHKHGWSKWLRVRCNNPDCPAVFLIREDAITDLVAAAFPAPEETEASP